MDSGKVPDREISSKTYINFRTRRTRTNPSLHLQMRFRQPG